MDIKKFYADTGSGIKVNCKDLLKYILSFDKVILWGASWLGKSVGRYLLSNHVNFDEYWDMRAYEIGPIYGKDVHLPFSKDYNRERTLVITCISNMVVQTVVRNDMVKERYIHNLIGFNIFMAALCPSDTNQGLNMSFCVNSKSCLKIYCHRLSSLFKLEHTQKFQPYPLHLNGFTLILNQICNLSCKHCTSYMNQYMPVDRINFLKENIICNINNFFSAIDSVATITVMGGEPFMHPDISDIIKVLLDQKKAGFISISTNGVYPIMPNQLPGLKGERVVVAFNNYLPSLPKKMRKVFDKNVELIKNAGIAYSIGNFMPNWTIPTTLYDLKRSEDDIKSHYEWCLQQSRRSGYGDIHRHLKNGRLYACDFSNALHSLKLADYPGDYVDVSDAIDLRKRLYDHYHARYYNACGHCRGMLGSAGSSAVQGKIDFITPPENEPLTQYIPGDLK
jgi:hypothetical protein